MRNEPKKPLVFDLKYGTAEVIGYERVDRTGCLRVERYTSKVGDRPSVENIHCAGPNDETPRHDKLNKYNSNCSCCWLNISHTEALHEQSLKRTAS